MDYCVPEFPEIEIPRAHPWQCNIEGSAITAPIIIGTDMRIHLILVTVAFFLTAACSSETESEPERSSSAVKVEVVRTEDGYMLLRGGKPYTVNGVGMGRNDIENFAAQGGNSIRTWNTGRRGESVRPLLDKAHEHGVTVALGLSMRKERHGFDYDDAEAVAAQLERMREEVLKYRDHPAVLVWLIGNELNLNYTNPRVFDAVNDVAEMIHELDPNHPVTTPTAGFKPEVNKEILARAPALDFISFQMYGSIFDFREDLARSDFDAPFMVTEWGTIGYWETETTEWGAPFESTSSEKADVFLRAYEDVLQPLEGQLLGSYAFFWGQKQERTPTWFGMLTEDGNETEVVDVMHHVWTGQWPDNRTPRVERLLLDGKGGRVSVVLAPGQQYEVVLDVVDPENGPLIYRWELKPESAATSAGGDYEEPIANLEGYLVDPAAAKTLLTAPPPGTYRLFAYAEDDQLQIAHANIPFKVFDDSERPADAPSQTKMQ
jgi:hypothetical protein